MAVGSVKRNLSITATEDEATQQCSSSGMGAVVCICHKRIVQVPIFLKKCYSLMISEFMRLMNKWKRKHCCWSLAIHQSFQNLSDLKNKV